MRLFHFTIKLINKMEKILTKQQLRKELPFRQQLRKEFPSLYVKDIDAALKINRFEYISTYHYLSTKIQKKVYKTKKGYDSKGFIDCTIECNCCCDKKMFEEFEQCLDGHIICKECIKTHAEICIYQKMTDQIMCVNCHENCDALYSENTIKNVLNERIFSEYKNIKKINEIKQLCIDDINIKICQHCDACIDVGPYFQEDILICTDCFKDTCLICNQVSHPGKLCYSLGNVLKSKRQEIEDKLTEALLIKCINCRATIFKNEGCNKITCVCGITYCYLCKKSNINYNHFCSNQKCSCNKCHLYGNKIKERLLDAVKNELNEETDKLVKQLL